MPTVLAACLNARYIRLLSNVDSSSLVISTKADQDLSLASVSWRASLQRRRMAAVGCCMASLGLALMHRSRLQGFSFDMVPSCYSKDMRHLYRISGSIPWTGQRHERTEYKKKTKDHSRVRHSTLTPSPPPLPTTSTPATPNHNDGAEHPPSIAGCKWRQARRNRDRDMSLRCCAALLRKSSRTYISPEGFAHAQANHCNSPSKAKT
jgi:hypothetical protein